MHKTSMILVGITILLLSPLAFAQSSKTPGKEAVPPSREPAVKSSTISGFLRDVVVSPQPKGIKIELWGDSLSVVYRSFHLSNPSRLAIDFPGVLSSFPKKFISLDHPLLKAIRIGQHPDKVRLVFLFPEADIPPYQIVKESTGLTLWIGEIGKENGEREKPAGAEEPERVETGAAREKKEIPAESKGEGEKTLTKTHSEGKISLDIRDGDLRSVFRLISEAAQREIVPGEEVKGTISLRLKDVPWEDALDAILSIYQLKKKEEGNRILILPR